MTNALVDVLRSADAVAVLTGAGISAASGISTFRDPDGLWEQFSAQELANVDAFLQNPERVQQWYRHRQQVVHEAGPNAGHRALAALESIVPTCTLITQNVDNLHQEAGSTHVLELHGNLQRNYCIDCGHEVAPAVLDDALAAEAPAQCPQCGGLIRPDVVWFGERLPMETFEAAQAAAQSADVFLSVGTSAEVAPASHLPLQAQKHGAFLAEFNTGETVLTPHVDAFVQGPADETLPALIDAL
ncbi:SIR2 family NAD-dependent protein deacylase [Salisaeta longa]|uniref:SIR2 family NAD-dependent protein deacylase n=1 Tax=Salisaeta longa TaxID=503170 RepID=UPI0003B6948A|nr:NAD-dependent deacylase [Salisaeta longa]